MTSKVNDWVSDWHVTDRTEKFFLADYRNLHAVGAEPFTIYGASAVGGEVPADRRKLLNRTVTEMSRMFCLKKDTAIKKASWLVNTVQCAVWRYRQCHFFRETTVQTDAATRCLVNMPFRGIYE